MVLGKVDIHKQKNKTTPISYHIQKPTKNVSNVRPKTIKLLERNIGGKSHDTSLGKDFLDMTPNKHQQQKQTISKWDCIKSKSKWPNQESEKATYRMVENIYKLHQIKN